MAQRQFRHCGWGTHVTTRHLSPTRVYARPQWPHVRRRLRCRGSISGQRRVRPVLLRWGRYGNTISRWRWVSSSHVSNRGPLPCRELLPELRRPRGDRQTGLPLGGRRGGRGCGVPQGRSVFRPGRSHRRRIRRDHRFVPSTAVFTAWQHAGR